MSKIFTLLEMAANFRAVAKDVELAEHLIVAKAAAMVCHTIRNDVIGRPHDYWPPLAESTLEHKAGNTPLYEHGTFRNSIGVKLGNKEAHVGTDDPRGIWFEHGTSKMPPRPWLWPGWTASEKDVKAMARKELRLATRGLGGNAQHLAQTLHILRELAHIAREIKDEFKELVEEEPKENRQRR